VDPLLRIVVAVLGAGIGATLASPADHVFGALIGAMAALGIAEFNVFRTRIRSLEEDVNRLLPKRFAPVSSQSYLRPPTFRLSICCGASSREAIRWCARAWSFCSLA
jgi:hypothetical protein